MRLSRAMTFAAAGYGAPASAARGGLRGVPLIVLTLALPPLRAQPSVELHVEQQAVYVNEPFRVDVRVENFEQCEPPALPEIPGCVVRVLRGGADSSQVLIINGRMQQTRTRTYQYELTPTKPGELVIPAVSVNVDGKTLETKPRRLIVRHSNVDELLWAEITCDDTKLYVGEQARFTLTIGVKPAEAGRYTLSEREMRGRFEGSNFGPFPADVNIGQTRRTMPDGSRQLYYTYEMSTDYIADRPGTLTFDDVVVGMDYPTRFERDMFLDLRVVGSRRLRVRPKVPPIDVLPLPAEGRPANFNGAVGRYHVSVTAEPISVRVGDPIELTIDISGDGPLETLPAPDLTAQTQLTESFRVPGEALAGDLVGGRRRFKQLIRAKHADVTEIPPIDYPYFDPQREQYVAATSEPIPLTVTAAELLEVADLTEITTPPAERPTTGLEPLRGLRGNETSEQALLARVQPIGVAHILAAAGAPAAAFLAFWGCSAIVQARRRDPARRRRQAALRHARQRLNQARALPPRDLAREIEATLAAYLADRVNEPAARFIGQGALDFLQQRGAKPELRDRCSKVIERCELASYGGATESDAESIAEQARACLTLLEKERL
jgi:hypothetical protein